MSSLKFEYIEYFVEACNHKSISKAASNLFITQQALSRSIIRLEEELGYLLFQRTVRGIQLTAGGKRFFETFSPIVRLYQNAILQTGVGTNRNPAGKLSLAIAPGTIRHLSPELLLNFKEMYPDIELEVTHLFDTHIEQYLQEDKRHFGLIVAPDWLLREKKQDFIPVLEEQRYLVVNRDNPLSSHSSVSLALLENERVLSPDRDHYFLEALNTTLKPYNFSVTPYYESNDFFELLGLVNRGLGVVLCTRQFFEEASLVNCVLLPLNERTFDYCISFVFQDYSALLPSARAFIEFTKTAVSQTKV